MTELTKNGILNIEIDTDVGVVTIRKYLNTLLTTLWEEAAGFNGKRPFGNGDWQWKVYEGLIKHGVIMGALDEDGYIEEINLKQADACILELIDYVFCEGVHY